MSPLSFSPASLRFLRLPDRTNVATSGRLYLVGVQLLRSKCQQREHEWSADEAGERHSG